MVGMQEGGVGVDVFWACGAVHPRARHAFGPFAQQLKDKVGVQRECWLSMQSLSGGWGGGRREGWMLMGSGPCGPWLDSTGHAFGPFAQQFKDKVGVQECSGCPESVSCGGYAGGRGGC